MKLFHRYITRILFINSLVVISAIVCILLLFNILRFSEVLEYNDAVFDLYALAFFIMPDVFVIILPLSTLISSLYSYNSSLRHNQLLLLKSFGLTNFQIVKPTIYVAIFWTFISYFTSEIISPIFYAKFVNTKQYLQNHYSAKLLQANKFHQIKGSTVIYIQNKLSSNVLSNVFIFKDMNNMTKNDNSILMAKYGKIANVPGAIVIQMLDGVSYQTQNNQKFYTNFDEFVFKIELNKIKNLSTKNPHLLSIRELIRLMLTESTQNKRTILATMINKILWPLYSPILALISIAIFVKMPYHQRSTIRKLCFSVLISMVLLISHLVLYDLSTNSVKMSIIMLLHFLFAISLIIILLTSRLTPKLASKLASKLAPKVDQK